MPRSTPDTRLTEDHEIKRLPDFHVELLTS